MQIQQDIRPWKLKPTVVLIILEKNIVGENSACQNQDIENNFELKSKKAFDNVVMAVKNGMRDAIMTAIDNVIIL